MHLHLDLTSGAAGDMLLAALLDAGADGQSIAVVLADTEVEGAAFRVERVQRGGIDSLLLTVPAEHAAHAHDEHGHHHHHHGPHRHLKDMLAIVHRLEASPSVRERAERVFRVLAEAEGAVHGKDPESVHFHEVAGVDTIVDVLGVCLALDALGIESVSALPPAVGSGIIRCAHGELPAPAPATVEILRRFRIPSAQVDSGCELLTPTGAALLAACVDRFGPAPAMTVASVGYGAGHRDGESRPNVVRALVGRPLVSTEAVAGLRGKNDRVIELRCAVDDMTAEAVAYLFEQAFAAGAVDAYAVPATMKKSRPGVALTVLAPEECAVALEGCLFRHGSSFGWRVQTVERTTLDRTFETVTVRGHAVRIKIGRYGDEIVAAQPEYDDCRALAAAEGVALQTIMDECRATWACASS